MIKLFPQQNNDNQPSGPSDPKLLVASEHRPTHGHRPWVMTNMIASADGATALQGVSGPLGTPADRSMVLALRNVADAIMAGATTVRSERYGVPAASTTTDPTTRHQTTTGRRPLIVVVSARLQLERDLPLFGNPAYRPMIATTRSAPEDRKQALGAVADVVEVGNTSVDLQRLMRTLTDRGASVVLSEGGPSINAQLINDNLIDEWNLTLSPVLAAGSSARPATGDEPAQPPPSMKLDRVWMADDLLFCRWVRPNDGPNRAHRFGN